MARSEQEMSLFASLDVYHDLSSRSAAMHMAIDEALLETAALPSIRFYRWASPALSFGYFGRFADVARHADGRDLVRRWTGGGIVFHGDDLTYSIVIPANDPLFGTSSVFLYEQIHSALRDALAQRGERIGLASVPAIHERRISFGECFANPVRADVVSNGRKIAGAAQRRTRHGLLQQGSIQHVDLGNGLAQRFTAAMSPRCEARAVNSGLLERAQQIAAQKYATEAWLRKR